jgi:hypothetical protein
VAKIEFLIRAHPRNPWSHPFCFGRSGSFPTPTPRRLPRLKKISRHRPVSALHRFGFESASGVPRDHLPPENSGRLIVFQKIHLPSPREAIEKFAGDVLPHASMPEFPENEKVREGIIDGRAMSPFQEQDKPRRLARAAENERMFIRIRPVVFDSIAAVVTAVGFRRSAHAFRHIVDVVRDEILDDRQIGRFGFVDRYFHLTCKNIPGQK